jgi:hypothetical protein
VTTDTWDNPQIFLPLNEPLTPALPLKQSVAYVNIYFFTYLKYNDAPVIKDSGSLSTGTLLWLWYLLMASLHV